MFIQFSSLLPQITQQLPNDQSINNNIVLSSALTNKQLNQHHNIGVDSRSNLECEETINKDEACRRREQLYRRPSYRMILKDLETVGDKQSKKELNESLTESPYHLHLTHNQHLPTLSGMGDNVSTSYESLINVSLSSMLTNRNTPEPLNANISKMLLTSSRLNVTSTTPRMFNTNVNITQQQTQQQEKNASSQLLSATAAAVAAACNSLNLPTSDCEIINLKPPSSSLTTDTLSITVSSADSTFSQNNDWQNDLLYNSSHHPGVAGNSTLTGGGIIQANTPGSMTSLSDNDDSNRKRQVRLLKNREAAKECRRKKKEYVKCLENRVSVLENQNKALIEELKTLKELYCRKEKSEIL